MTTILLVDDEPDIHQILDIALRRDDSSLRMEHAYDGAEALQVYRRLQRDIDGRCLVLMDIKMPGMDGIEATRRLVDMDPDSFIYIFTAYAHTDYAVEALNAGARGLIQKSDDIREMLARIQKAAARVDNI
ncbi:MAG: response regulator [Thermoplasmatota archaeon]